jgi:hypothetical protein
MSEKTGEKSSSPLSQMQAYWNQFYSKVHPYRLRLSKETLSWIEGCVMTLATCALGTTAFGGATWLIRKRWQHIVIPLGFLSRFAPLSRLVGPQLIFPLRPAQDLFFRVAKCTTVGAVSISAFGLAARKKGVKIGELQIPLSSQKAGERLKIQRAQGSNSMTVEIACMLGSQSVEVSSRIGHALQRIVGTLKDQSWPDAPHLKLYETPKDWTFNQLFDKFNQGPITFISCKIGEKPKTQETTSIKTQPEAQSEKEVWTVWTACFLAPKPKKEVKKRMVAQMLDAQEVEPFQLPGMALQMPGLAFLAAQCDSNCEQLELQDGQAALVRGVYAYADLFPDQAKEEFLKMSKENVNELLPLKDKPEEKRLFMLPSVEIQKKGNDSDYNVQQNIKKARQEVEKKTADLTVQEKLLKKYKGNYLPLTQEQLISLYKPVYNAFFHIRKEAGDKKVVVETGNWGVKEHGNPVLSILIQMLAAQAAVIDEFHYVAVTDEDEQAFQDASQLREAWAKDEKNKQISIGQLLKSCTLQSSELENSTGNAENCFYPSDYSPKKSS